MIYNSQEVSLALDHYADNNNIAILMLTEDSAVYAIVSKNIQPLAANCFAVDINNLPDIADWLIVNDIAEDTGGTVVSGYVVYPIYRLLVDLPSIKRN